MGAASPNVAAKRIQHFLTDFKRIRADARPQGRDEVFGAMSLVDCEHAVNRRGNDPRDHAAPARVNGRDRATVGRGDQYRKAVSRSDRNRPVRIAANQCIGKTATSNASLVGTSAIVAPWT